MTTKGTLFGVSVGPGEAELLTLKAVRIIEQCPVLAIPRTPGGGTVALDIVREVIDINSKELLMLDFAMSHDTDKRDACHAKAADLLRAALAQGRSVAMLNLGDVSLYASYQAMARRLRADFKVEMIPGVPSFCAAAARCGMSLVEGEASLHLYAGGSLPPHGLGAGDTQIHMKSGRHLGRLLEEVEHSDMLGRALLVQNCGMENERVFYGSEAKQAPKRYFSILIVKEKAEE